ncbi:MAG: GAF domain-containing protein [candidate division Zixibacteria bacterium]|nr:GAF domain-containing protein [candidate division Zixibacteria bacterium]
MQPRFESSKYEFIERLSRNEAAESWTALNKKTGAECFLKLAVKESPLGEDAVRNILIKSFESQKCLKSPAVHGAVSKRLEKGNLIIEYPFIDSDRWKTLAHEIVMQKADSILPEIFLIIDYLHFMGQVHCDLKLANFMVSENDDTHRVKLTDLDFLQPNYSAPQGKILGTPDHIAPEVLSNEIFTTQSDIYSIGKSLQISLENAEEFDGEHGHSIHSLIDHLTAEDPIDRPSVLIDTLLSHKIINQKYHADLNRRLFAMQLLSAFKSEIRLQNPTPGQLKRILQKDNKLFGINEELYTDFLESHKLDRRKTFQIALSLFKQADLNRFEDFWHLKISDDTFDDCLSAFDRISNKSRGFPQLKELISKKDLNNALSLAKESFATKAYLRSYQMFKEIFKAIGDSGSEFYFHLIEELIQNAIALNRTVDAIGYLNKKAEIKSNDISTQIEIYLDLVFQHIKSGKVDDAAVVIERGLDLSEELSDKNAILEFNRLKAWIISIKGSHEKARNILEDIIEAAAETKNDELLVKTYNYMGSLGRRTGDFDLAEEYYLKSVELAKSSGIMPAAISSMTNLSMLAFETAEYKKSIKYAREALRSIENPEDLYTIPYNHRMLTLCFARVGEYNKAEYWNQEYLSYGLPSYSADVFGTYYLNNGWIQLNRGKILRSAGSILRAIHILESAGASQNLGKAYLSLAQNSLYRGEAEQSSKYAGRAKKIFGMIGDSASLADIELIEVMNRIYNQQDNSFIDLLEIFKRLLGFNSTYFAALALMHLLLNDRFSRDELILDESPGMSAYLEPGETPLFRATNALMEYRESDESDYLKNANLLKSIYRTLHDSGLFFESVLLCEKIANHYFKHSQNKLAAKFIRQGLKLTERIKNKNQASHFQNKLESIPVSERQKEQAVDYLHSISDIIRDLTDYRATLEKLIQFAVEETGAERGVLLMRSDPHSDLKVRSYINCDDDSLQDIRDFSRSIPFEVSRNLEPFIIDNAMTDSRTRGFKSIAIHNILSVICMPIFKDNYAVGVIYLDHHTIPALFDEDDIRLINSMANLISMVLTTAMDYRTVRSSRDRMLYDLTRMGSSQSFITQNEEMLETLDKLPRIAATNTSILLSGESGTGKEILCEMIHEYSLRRDAPLVKLNCAAIPDTLIESELFGVAKHAATGVDAREGKFQAADGGTLFLDEIGDMPLETQAKILRVIEYQEFEKVGSNRRISTDIRFIYATNQNLHEMVEKESFRRDLFYRINTFSIEIPPLRKRQEDIPILLEHFIKIFSKGSGNPTRISTPAMDRMVFYKWPGNVRELKNIIEKFCILYPGKTVEPGDLPSEMHDKRMLMSEVSETAKVREKQTIRKLLIENDWNQSEVARILDMPLSTLRRRIKKYGIKKL